MNKYILGAFLLSLTSTAVSCSSEDAMDDKAAKEGSKVTITAEVSSQADAAAARVEFAADGLSLLWQEADEIGITTAAQEAGTMTLTKGAGTANAVFSGKITKREGAMCAFYPKEAATTGVDLTTQSATLTDATKRLVLFGSTESWNYNPSFTMSAKVSLLKLQIPLPQDMTNISQFTVKGAYAKGKLNAEGSWENLEKADITLSNFIIQDNLIQGYVVVLPGSPVKDLYLELRTDDYLYESIPFTAENVTVPGNEVIAFTQRLMPVQELKIYYLWDAVNHAKSPEGNDGAQLTGNYAVNSCRDCPSIYQLKKYFGAGIYFDKGEEHGTQNLQYYKCNGQIFHAGVWLKRNEYIGEDVQPSDYGKIIEVGRPSAGEIDQYFFLPLWGYYNPYFDGGRCDHGGDEAIYWLNESTTTSGYYMTISLKFTSCNLGNNTFTGGILWKAK